MEEFRIYYPENFDNIKGDIVELICKECKGCIGWRVKGNVPDELHFVHDFAVVRGQLYCRDHYVLPEEKVPA